MATVFAQSQVSSLKSQVCGQSQGSGLQSQVGDEQSTVHSPQSTVRSRPSTLASCLLSPVSCLLLFWFGGVVQGASADGAFGQGIEAYRTGDFAGAAKAFRQSTRLQPASGTLQNLGNAEWQRGEAGAAVLAWEQALWLNPFNQPARLNLRYARRLAQLEAPDLAWYEVVSTWLPVNWWAWIAGGSLWLAVGMGTGPGLLRWRKAAWHQALAALGLMVFLLSLPAQLGVQTRSHIGFVVQKDTPLRLTPTRDAQVVTRLAAGEPVRWERTRGNLLLIRTSHEGFRGWVDQEQVGLTSPRAGRKGGEAVSE